MKFYVVRIARHFAKHSKREAPMRILFYCTALIVSTLAISGCSGDNSEPEPEPTRSFSMGFTPFPYDVSLAAVDDVYAKLANNADIMAHHFDNGIPWNEALVDAYPYDDHIMNDWAGRLARTSSDHKVYVAVTPINLLRDGLALYRKGADDLPLESPFDTHGTNTDFNNTEVKTAYLNYCKRVIAYFNPNYFGIGIEVNLLRKNSEDLAVWAKYVELNQYVYTELKQLYPDLPIFVSVSPVEMVLGYTTPSNEFVNDPIGFRQSQLTALSDVIGYSDYYAISLYPFLTAFYNTQYPSDFFDQLFTLSTKPIAIAETGMAAESFRAFGLDFAGTEALQNTYISDLLANAEVYSAKFVVNFVLQDYDLLCTSISCSDFEQLWKNTGLYDGTGNLRPSHDTWMSYLIRPVQNQN